MPIYVKDTAMKTIPASMIVKLMDIADTMSLSRSTG